MQLVVTHTEADFDGLAAAIGAQRLYPESRIVLGPLSAGVRQLVAVHRDLLPIVPPEEVDQAAVRRVIVVDVRRANRLGFLPEIVRRIDARDPSLEVHVFDHHPATGDDMWATVSIVESVGSSTTLVVEAIKKRELSLSTVEATLLALGIHVDTGSLCFGGSTSRDAAALAWLMEQGAVLTVVNHYLKSPMGSSQQRALSEILALVEIERVGGARIAIASLDRTVARLDEVASETLSLIDSHALFVIAPRDKQRGAHVIARSRAPFVDVERAVRTMGGGGHPTAAACTTHLAPENARAAIIAAIHADPPCPARVCDIMASPVTTVGTKTPLQEAKEELARARCSGLPVVKNGSVVGVLSQRDIAKAERKGQMDREVRRFMSAPARTLDADATVEEALRLMERKDIGRLPVLHDGRLVGIVTRKDVIASLYKSGGQESRVSLLCQP